MKQKRVALLAAAAMLVLIFDSKTAIESAKKALQLCTQSVIPGIFVLLFLTSLLISHSQGAGLFLSRIGRLCHIPAGFESILIPGLLGGYPVGAANIAQLYKTGAIDRKSAQHLLRFCSNAGPAFIFGVVATQFSSHKDVWLLWLIQILSAIITGMISPFTKSTAVTAQAENSQSVTQLLKNAIYAMAQICGWVILMQVVCGYAEKWFLYLFSQSAQVLLAGLLELTGGCCRLSQIHDERLRFVTANVMISFGSLSVILQTKSVIGSLKIGDYLVGKASQCAISLLLSLIVLLPTAQFATAAAILAIIVLEAKKTVAISEQVVYNNRKHRQTGAIHAVSKKDRAFVRVLRPWRQNGRGSGALLQKRNPHRP